jgi:adenylate cyclase
VWILFSRFEGVRGDYMNTQGFKRKLTAILSADVKEYSRLMSQDEAQTVKTLTTYREILASLIKQHRGRMVDSPGDNVLAEFGSVVDATQCAVAVQKELQARNAELPEKRRMEFRIGINLGDVIEEGDRIYGDGVNIAARLEALADPGGICISKTGFDHIESKLPLGYEYLGEQTVKNIPKPVGAYRVLMEPRITVAEEIEKEKAMPLWQRKAILPLVIAVLAVAIVLAIWKFYLSTSARVEVASVEKMAFPLPEKPSIAVLPFANMNDDPNQEYFSDGITEDLITDLSKISGIFVIARASTFTYKGKSVKIRQVAEELGVRYVLEGSVRRTGEQVRINAQLIDALTGHHLWAERYDRNLEDMLAVQDEITEEIVTALDVKLVRGEQTRLWRKSLKDPEARDSYYRGREIVLRFTKEAAEEARELFEQVIKLEPDSPLGYAWAAWTHYLDAWRGWGKDPAWSLKRAGELAQKALSLDDNNADAHSLLGWIYSLEGRFEEAIAEGERAVAISPSGADVAFRAGQVLLLYGRSNEAIVLVKKAMRLNPIPPALYFNILGVSYRESKQYEEAISALKEGIARYPGYILSRYALVTTYCALERYEEARAEAQEIFKIDPRFNLEEYTKRLPYNDPAVNERLLNDLRRAGLLE